MHMLIRILVPADDRDEAVMNARSALDQLVEANAFDSYSVGEDSVMDMPNPARADTPAGRAQAELAFTESKDESMRNIEDIRTALGTFTTDELFEANPGNKDDPGNNCRMFRFLCSQLGMNRGTGVCLYDEHGCGILTTRELEDALKKVLDADLIRSDPVQRR